MLVMQEIAELSDRLVVMSQLSSQFLQEIFKVPGNKIDMVPHGVPDLPFLDPNFYKDRFGVEGKAVLLTFGLLSPNKGIENVIQASRTMVAVCIPVERTAIDPEQNGESGCGISAAQSSPQQGGASGL